MNLDAHIQLNTMSAEIFMTTLPQKAERNDALFDLWRNNCCAKIAPGQPQTKPSSRSVLSLVRQPPLRAADLSKA
jgi:hypothetical protein